VAAREAVGTGWVGLPGRDQATEGWLKELFAALFPLADDVHICVAVDRLAEIISGWLNRARGEAANG